jgi:hypothetical protein
MLIVVERAMGNAVDVAAIRRKFLSIRDQLDERGRRLFVAAEVRALGRGGLAAVARATGVARSTIGRGLKDIDGPALPAGHVRRVGSGRRPLTADDPTLLDDLRRLIEPMTLGDPMRPLLWVSKSHAKLAAALRQMGHQIGPRTVAKLLRQLGYSRQCNSKANGGSHHVDRDAQFEHINAQVLAFQAEGQPVISVDTKKKELVGSHKNAGTDYRPAGKPLRVSTHDFADPELGKVVPYGVYDIADNSGWVSVGIDHDTAEFAVCHYPPGTSKWNKIGHRLFCHITRNWQARPLTSRLAVVELIAATSTKTGLTVACELDDRLYAAGIKVPDADMDALNIVRADFHPEWNYTIAPRKRI